MNTNNLTTAITDLHAQITAIQAKFTKKVLPADEIFTLMLLGECFEKLEKSAHVVPASTNK